MKTPVSIRISDQTPMEGEELRAIMAAHGVGRTTLARMLDVRDDSVAKWVRGRGSVPGPLAGWLRALDCWLRRNPPPAIPVPAPEVDPS